MGTQLLARAALPMAHLHLSPGARLVLWQMARVTRDQDDPPIYWGGWELLSHVLNYDYWPDPVAKRAVARAVAELVEVGLVKPVQGSGGRRPARYELRLGP